ncbi:ABC transporter substrate-binding protein [Streptomyces griseocarneus]|uniref:ABC transporter substrate-binding protein n=1 Tax=Streptomyces griseocarneus TaxID=51201 RepID=UPI00167CA9C9|nr:ABC transporter substrate-binding protein [Streptomyces griseocarneus]MBZ6474662.1 ABC transporter substrate-binding protein [Streptomyces griseocarneus]GHG66978.1 ABC transporter [Streptomyces griseocarneus]
MVRISPRTAVVPALATAAALLMCSCSAGAGADGGDQGKGVAAVKSGQRLTATLGTAKDSQGPAPAVEGARSGGTIHVANLNDYAHLDPQKIYAGEGYSTSLLWGRQLTQYQVVDGKPKLVGDLATDTGTSSDGGRTWTYRLKDGIAWEDGEPITAEHVKYGIERTFAPGFELGPSYWPEWLTGSEDRSEAVKKYGGPRDGDLDAIETPDDKTIVFHFPRPQSDVPYMAAQSSSSPVRKDKDTGTGYDVRPFASGPYRITGHQQNRGLTLERNPHWKAETDPIRHQYPERFEFTFGKKGLNTAQEVLNGRGAGPDTVTTRDEVPPELFAEAGRDPKKRELVVAGSQGAYTSDLYIKNSRVTDPEVRKAIHYLFPREQARQVLGGPRVGDFATTLSSPAVVGWKKYDLYPVAPAGDIAKAKEHLARAKHRPATLTYAYESGTPEKDRLAQVLVEAFAKAGVKLVTRPMDKAAFNDQVFRGDAPYDLWLSTNSVDWPTPATLLPDGYHSRLDALSNSTRYANAEVDRELERIARIGDAQEKADALIALEQVVMKDVPVVPFLYTSVSQFRGRNIGGASIHPVYGSIAASALYLKKS